MTEEQRQLVMDLVIMPNRRSAISPGDFASRFPSALSYGKLAPSLLAEAVHEKKSDDLQIVLIIGSVFGFSSEHTPALCDLLNVAWHSSHEDIVSILQNLKDPRAVESLGRTASSIYEYLAYDEFSGLARKCTWALADIGTPEAKKMLERLTLSKNPLIVEYAQKRLDRWSDELHRKK